MVGEGIGKYINKREQSPERVLHILVNWLRFNGLQSNGKKAGVSNSAGIFGIVTLKKQHTHNIYTT